MIGILQLLLKRLPWILLIIAIGWIAVSESGVSVIPGRSETRHALILDKVVNMGKLELVKYNFQEVTELKKISAELDLKVIKLKSGPDSKAVLISKGEAVGCIDLTRIRREDLRLEKDTLFVRLPAPELCYFKIDLQESNIYDLDLGYLSSEEKKQFLEELYRKAESEMRDAAIESGILELTLTNAQLILKPFLEQISNRKVELIYAPEPGQVIERL